MEILFIGTGSAFCLKNFHSNAIVIENGKHLLIDAGGDVRFALSEQHLSYKDIDAVYISHFHTDHIGGLEYLAFKSFFDKGKPKIKLYIHESFVQPLWDNSLKAGLGMIFNTVLQLTDYFEVIALKDHFTWENIHFELIETLHVSENYNTLPVYGLMLTQGKSVYITGDTRYIPEGLSRVYEQADIIIHDAETAEVKSVIHSHFDHLSGLPAEIRDKTYLWHYQDNVSADYDSWQKKALEAGFRGFLKRGERIRI